MLKIGVCTGRLSPAVGGMFSLTDTIIKEIKRFKNKKYQFVIFSREQAEQRVMEKEGITYVSSFGDSRDFNVIASEQGVDLLWLLGEFNLNLTIPYIFPVLDLGPRLLPHFPEMRSQYAYRENTYQNMLYKASSVITGNETGKKEILENFSIDSNKVRIAPFPISDFCKQSIEIATANEDVKKPFVFYPAQFWAHKNHISILEAIVYLRDVKNVIVNCCFVGSDKGNQKYIQNKISEFGLEKQVEILGFVEHSTLTYLYKNALAMVYISLLGPNNLPPLEAAALGCPIILSKISGHLEQMNDVPLYVSPTSPEEIGLAIFEIYSNSAKRQDMIIKGLSFAEQFKSYSFTEEVSKIFDDFSKHRKMWGM